mmetsp:Transcript_2874/g.6525  ORF Transcript_2874/g.6525 Transcript_2874/m.6525 type:complete len:83 (-) Transcript_2874:445-693(-)
MEWNFFPFFFLFFSQEAGRGSVVFQGPHYYLLTARMEDYQTTPRLDGLCRLQFTMEAKVPTSDSAMPKVGGRVAVVLCAAGC